MLFPLPNEVRFIIEEYEKHGHSAHVVGGPVRDYLLGIAPHDYDLTTDATPEQTKEIFSDFRIIETGIRHGTVTLLLSGIPYEITTYRIDGEYLDNRHPEQVTFTRSLSDDLSRRDFTVNAMAYAPRDGIVDLFCGKEDLKNRVLRTVGMPTDRFREDALRILRALRFASVLGFSIEKGTANAISECAPLMKNLAVERISEELIKLFDGKHAVSVMHEYAEPLAVVLSELSPAFATIERLPTLPDTLSRAEAFAARLAYLAFLSSLNGDALRALCERLHTSREVRELSAMLLTHLADPIETDYDLLVLLKSTSPSALKIMLCIKNTSEEKRERALCRLESLLEQNAAYRIGDLAIGGAELLRFGISGKDVGVTLTRLLDAVMRGRVKNERDALISYLNL